MNMKNLPVHLERHQEQYCDIERAMPTTYRNQLSFRLTTDYSVRFEKAFRDHSRELELNEARGAEAHSNA